MSVTKIISCIVILICGMLLPGHTLAEKLEEKARAYFENKQSQEASTIWYEILNSGKVTSGVYYNIGLAQSNLGQVPQAMIAFEKALRLKPSSNVIQKAIQLEKENMPNAIIPVKPFFLLEWTIGLLALFRPGYWSFFGMIALITAALLYIRRNYFSNKSNPFLQSRAIPVITGFGLVFLLLAFLSYTSLYRDDEAILQVPCEIRQAPSEESPHLLAISPGEKMVILDQLTGWYHVRLLNIEEGWIKSDCVTRIIMGTR